MNKEGSSATDLRGILALPLVANRGCWLMLAMPGTANDNLKSKIMLSSCHTTHLLGCFLALSWDKLGVGLLLAVTRPWAACSGSSLLGR